MQAITDQRRPPDQQPIHSTRTTMNLNRIQACGALAAALLAGPALAAGHLIDITWTPDGGFAHKTQISAGKFVEVCGKLTAGEAVRWGFESAAAVDFNIHYHAGKEVIYPTRQAQVKAGRDTLKVELSQDYCWMWTNTGAIPASLTVKLNR